MADQQQQVIGYVFLGLMVFALILAITTFEGTPTMILILSAIVFLVVGLSVLGSGGKSESSGQQQSVVLGGRTITQSSDAGVLSLCGGCNGRIPETAKFCPGCGNSVA